MHSDSETTPIIASISEFSETCDVWLVDVWGVMHNGVAAFQDAVAACQTFREHGGYVLLLTNAPRPAAAVVEQLDHVGVARAAYDAVVTSGDVTRQLLQEWKGRPIYHIGPERDLSVFSDLEISFAPLLEADAIVCTGLVNDEIETPDHYAAILKDFLGRGAVMLCANPDLKVERGNKIIYCAGAIGQVYEDAGGEVIYSGKPYLPIYDLALNKITRALKKDIKKERVIAIGDGVFTDIKGAAAAGIRSVFIASGIHVERTKALDGEMVKQLFITLKSGKPIAAMPSLAW